MYFLPKKNEPVNLITPAKVMGPSQPAISDFFSEGLSMIQANVMNERADAQDTGRLGFGLFISLSVLLP